MALFVLIIVALLSAAPGMAGGTPVVHTTDLYHPPMDPDDHLDLATLFALTELDVRAVIFDSMKSVFNGPFSPGDQPREPGFVPLAQLCYLTGRSVPAAMGPLTPLTSPADKALDRSRREQAGVELLLRALRDSSQPVIVTVLGSARIVTVAFNREPDLLRKKVKAVVVNAGTAAGPANEYNVEIDVNAYVGLFRSGLPIWWFPCVGKVPKWDDPANSTEHDTFWRAPHSQLFRGLPQPLLAWFIHALAGNSRGDILRALDEQGRGASVATVRTGERFLWSTASLAMAAGRVLAKTPEGWRFVPNGNVPAGALRETLALDPVSLTISDKGVTQWEPHPSGSNVLLFRRTPGAQHTAAMTEALNALLRSLPVE